MNPFPTFTIDPIPETPLMVQDDSPSGMAPRFWAAKTMYIRNPSDKIIGEVMCFGSGGSFSPEWGRIIDTFNYAKLAYDYCQSRGITPEQLTGSE